MPKSRIWKSKRGTTDEAIETPPYLAIAGILILVSLGLAVRWFYFIFIEPPSQVDSYAAANLDRLETEIATMLEMGEWRESKVIPLSLFGFSKTPLVSKRRSLVAINPDLDPPTSSGCGDEGAIEYPDYCDRYPCLCLCEDTDCVSDENCITFKTKDYGKRVRLVGIEQTYNPKDGGWAVCPTGEEDFNTGTQLPYDLDPLGMNTFHELVLYSFCHLGAGCGWGSEDDKYYDNTGYLYIEETKGEDGYTYILIGQHDEVTELRMEAIENANMNDDDDIQGCVPLDRCLHESMCEGEFGTETQNQHCRDYYDLPASAPQEEYGCCMADNVEICKWDGDDYTFEERKCGSTGNWWLHGCGTGWSCGCNMDGTWTLDKTDCEDVGKVCAQGVCVNDI